MLDKVLITGSTGFLGKTVINKLNKTKEYQIIGLGGKAQWDLTNQKYVDYVLQEFEPDYVIHLAAACGGIGINREQPGRFLYENLSMGMNLIETCRKYGRLKNFIMVGTVCSYPKHTPVPFKESDLWNGYPEETNAPYGIAKKTLIEMLIAYNKQYGFQSTNLIPVNMYGPNDNFNPKSSHVIPALILKIDRAISKGDSSIEIWGSGKASREFLYVDDCAEAICQCLETCTTPYPINIGTSSEITIGELVTTLKDIMGFSGSINYNKSFPDGQPRRCLDVNNAYKILGFKAKTKLYDGLKQTVSWYYRHKEQERFFEYFDYIQ
jgi:nucleoside-diphosphate-sugar epimerase